MKDSAQKSEFRGRPRRSAGQAAAHRDRIIQASRELFAENGYDGVSMRKIAAAASCSPAMLYTLFPNKRRLLRHIWEAVFAELMNRLEACFTAHPGPGAVEAMCLEFVSFWRSRPDDYRAIFLIEDRLSGAQDRYFVDSSETLPRLSVLRRAIEDAQQRGELRPGPPDEIQNILLCGVQGVALNTITIPEYPWGDPDRLAARTVRALLDGLRGREECS